jgi:hypothetical protein
MQQMHNACGVVMFCIALSATTTTARYTCKCTGFQAYRGVSGLGGRIGVGTPKRQLHLQSQCQVTPDRVGDPSASANLRGIPTIQF